MFSADAYKRSEGLRLKSISQHQTPVRKTQKVTKHCQC